MWVPVVRKVDSKNTTSCKGVFSAQTVGFTARHTVLFLRTVVGPQIRREYRASRCVLGQLADIGHWGCTEPGCQNRLVIWSTRSLRLREVGLLPAKG